MTKELLWHTEWPVPGCNCEDCRRERKRYYGATVVALCVALAGCILLYCIGLAVFA